MKDLKAMFELLRFSLEKTPLSDVVKSLTEEELQNLYVLTKRHDLAHLIGDALDKNGLLPEDSEIKKRFFNERNMAVYRYEQLQYELDCIKEIFEQEQIAFMPLKGSVIRLFYPEPWMRTSCDIDILVHEEDLQKSIAILKEKRNYICEMIGEYDAQLYSEGGVHIELHYQLVDSESKISESKILKQIWEYEKNSKQYYRKMSDEMFYCYHISHIAKHLKFGGCGIRSLMDIWILNHKIAHDKSEREALLQKAELLTLAKALENLSEVWFSGKEADALSEELAQYVLKGGVYGSLGNKIAAQQSRKKNKFVYILSRVFLPYGQLKYTYPKLQKYPILYPFYVVKRWFKLFEKESKQKAVKELHETTGGDKEKHERIRKLLQDLDI